MRIDHHAVGCEVDVDGRAGASRRRTAVVTGHSLGGGTAAQPAQVRPDLVTALLLEDPPLSFGDGSTPGAITAFGEGFAASCDELAAA